MILIARTLGLLALAGAGWSATFDTRVCGTLILAAAILIGASLVASKMDRLPPAGRYAELEARVAALSVEHDTLSAGLKSLEAIIAALKAEDANVTRNVAAFARRNQTRTDNRDQRGGDNVRRLFADK